MGKNEYYVAIHARHVTILPKDLCLVSQMQVLWQNYQHRGATHQRYGTVTPPGAGTCEVNHLQVKSEQEETAVNHHGFL